MVIYCIIHQQVICGIYLTQCSSVNGELHLTIISCYLLSDTEIEYPDLSYHPAVCGLAMVLTSF